MPKPAPAKKNKPLTKAQLLATVCEGVDQELQRKHVKHVVEVLTALAHKELKKNGVFVLPGFAKFVVVRKPARPAARGSTRSPRRSRRSRRNLRAGPCACARSRL
jgi:nucleoid DNA-binding protein